MKIKHKKSIFRQAHVTESSLPSVSEGSTSVNDQVETPGQ